MTLLGFLLGCARFYAIAGLVGTIRSRRREREWQHTLARERAAGMWTRRHDVYRTAVGRLVTMPTSVTNAPLTNLGQPKAAYWTLSE